MSPGEDSLSRDTDHSRAGKSTRPALLISAGGRGDDDDEHSHRFGQTLPKFKVRCPEYRNM